MMHHDNGICGVQLLMGCQDAHMLLTTCNVVVRKHFSLGKVTFPLS